jgi:pentatricopeptide repeat protein
MVPDVHSFTNLINAYVRCNQMKNAMKLFQIMKGLLLLSLYIIDNDK